MEADGVATRSGILSDFEFSFRLLLGADSLRHQNRLYIEIVFDVAEDVGVRTLPLASVVHTLRSLWLRIGVVVVVWRFFDHAYADHLCFVTIHIQEFIYFKNFK